MARRSRGRRTRTLGLVLAGLVAGGCGPVAIDYMDYEAYVRPQTNPAAYKRAAVLYVGYGQGSTVTQSEDVGKRGEQLNKGDDSRMMLTGSEAQGADVVLFSNALLTAFDRHGVQVIERARVRDVVREQGLAANRMLDMDDPEALQRLGRMLKVDLIVRGTVLSYQGGVQTQVRGIIFPRIKVYYSGATGLSLRGIDTRTGQVVWLETAFADRRIPPKLFEQEEKVAATQVVNSMVEKMVDRFYRGGN